MSLLNPRPLTAAALSRFGLLTLCFSRFLLTTIPAQAVLLLSVISRGRIVLHRRIALYILAATCYWAVVFLLNPSTVIVSHILFYSGFVVPLVAFLNTRTKSIVLENRYIIGICGLVVLEAILVNSGMLRYLYFFPPEGSSERVLFFGFYQRPLGIAGNASMTAGVLVFTLALRDHFTGNTRLLKPTTILTFIAILLLASGAGFLFFFAYVTIHTIRTFRMSVRWICTVLGYTLLGSIVVMLAFTWLTKVEDFNKASAEYYVQTYDYKVERAEGLVTEKNWLTIWLGNQVMAGSIAETSGDFGYAITLGAIGICGLSLVVLVPLLFLKAIPHMLTPTIFFYLSFIHYPGLLSPPGQVVFAYYIYLLAQARRGRRHGTRGASMMGNPPKVLAISTEESSGA
jgi:hypothetical protein